MSESIQLVVGVKKEDIPLLQAAISRAQGLATAHRFSVTTEAPDRVLLALEADDLATLVAGVEAIGPAFVMLDGRAQVGSLSFSAGVSASVRARLARAAW